MKTPSIVYLIRHGIAENRVDNVSDEKRQLTKEGVQKTRKVANRLHQLNIHFDLILTSPLLRARQTADILQTAGLGQKIKESTSLVPNGDINNWLNWYQQWRQSGGHCLALVGHQPDQGNWAEILVWGESREGLILKKAGVIGLVLPETGDPVGNSSLFWLTCPKLLL
ncbi:phosphohistidine phosphatase SixA [Laspinema olomoucense]|uniref:Phosphohistidine phosphatase SixA n=1 Tax=Laspinema olomoucense D3b TaxID=2953688 RepID=A0ABT2N193_9CYAN|nr:MULTISPECIES: phosphohistidine phosphatase SixA [unclassified Laspinema]MCT7970966.1 phosphohistidine phosphatase SixA [Laspinema sp. D3d]MCT7976216.1 phosphohistidine phosphatase SixA [Laspinema sp. D3b]MCT7989964.1 phosphohistidine phosphatase SixA [Laspinema sp. D3a]MCT7995719.1 phosphohistidine phosphatase SixA [Laspinema sp. D3c]